MKIINVFKYGLVICFVFLIIVSYAGSAKANGWTSSQLTSSSYDSTNIQMQVDDGTIYYVYTEEDASGYTQIWTATMNIDGTGWSATKRTSDSYNKYNPQLQVVGNIIYYAYAEDDSTTYNQIYTATMNTDGTGWSAVARTSSSYDRSVPQMEVVETKIYYVWLIDSSGTNQIATAVMNTDGTGFLENQRTTYSDDSFSPQLQVDGSTIYYVFTTNDIFGYSQIHTATMGTGGSGWSDVIQTSSAYDKHTPQMQLVGSTIYYVYVEADSYGGLYGPDTQVWTATMSTGGGDWSETQRTTDGYDKIEPQLEVAGSTIYYAYIQFSSEHGGDGFWDLWTAEMSTGGSGFTATARSAGQTIGSPQLDVYGTTNYYAWSQNISGIDQIMEGRSNNDEGEGGGAIPEFSTYIALMLAFLAGIIIIFLVRTKFAHKKIKA